MSGTLKILSRCKNTKSCSMIFNSCFKSWTTHRLFSSEKLAGNKLLKDKGRKFADWSQEELAMLTETEKCLPLVEAIMESPLLLEDWEKMTKTQQNQYAILSDVFSHDKLQSVNAILKNTMHPLQETILQRWKTKNIEKLGEEKFTKNSIKTITEGKEIHKLIQDYLKGEITIEGDGSGQWKSFQQVLKEISPDDVHSVEADLIHPMLFYSGKLDCAVKFQNKLCIIDWKLASKRKDNLKHLYDVPYQVAAYVGAFNIMNNSSTQVTNAVIVRGYRDGSSPSVHYLNEFALGFYWKGWLRKLARNHVRILNSQLMDDV